VTAPHGAAAERELAARVLEALLREHYAGVRSRVSADGGELRLPGAVSVRLRRVRGMLAERVVDPASVPGLDILVDAVRALADPCDDVDGLAAECRAALAARRLHDAVHDDVLARLRDEPRVGPVAFYDTLAAFTDHPVYPASRARVGLTADELRLYAPEFAPRFELRWAEVPPGAVTAGVRPEWWPTPGRVGLARDAACELFPVHPLMAARVPGLAPRPYLEVTPTLSMRTVCVLADPATHLKLPLPTSTLGRRNRRSIVPRTLHDGALVQRLLSGILDREPDLPVLMADEQTYGHVDEHLGFLVRRFPAETLDARVVPVAALLARTPSGRTVAEELDDDVAGFFGRYLEALFALGVRLFVAYGIALETHQQNLSLVVGEDRLDLLVKDNDGALVPPDAPGAGGLADRRMVTADPEALAQVFVTITLHLCAGAIAFGLAERGLLPLATGLGLIRDRLAHALATNYGPRADLLRARTLDAERLAAKAMLTAGTLVGKERTGAADINKHYGPSGPNYLHPDYLRGNVP
jgi:siderophore synthetase component